MNNNFGENDLESNAIMIEGNEESDFEWDIATIQTWIAHEYQANQQRNFISLIVLWIFTICQVYLMVGLSLEFGLYQSATNYKEHNEAQFCDSAESNCFGKFHYRTIMALITCTGIILVNVVNEFEQINVQFMGNWIDKNEKNKDMFSLNSVQEFFLNLLFPFRTYVILIAVVNSTMNLLTTDISVPSVVLNGLSITFILSVDDLIYDFHSGQAKCDIIKVSHKHYDYIISSKQWILFIIFVPTMTIIYIIIDNEQQNNANDYDQWLIMGCCLYCLIIFFVTRIHQLNNISKRNIIYNILAEVFNLVVCYALVSQNFYEQYINEIK